MERYQQRQLTENEIAQSTNAIACLNDLRETYRANSTNTPYLLAAKNIPNPNKKDTDVVQELYSTNNGLVKKVFERANLSPGANTRVVSIDMLRNLPELGTFPVTEEEISKEIKYFNLRSNTVLGIVNLVEKELKIDVDKRNLMSEVQECVFSQNYFG